MRGCAGGSAGRFISCSGRWRCCWRSGAAMCRFCFWRAGRRGGMNWPVRTAIGAQPRRIVRQLLTESLLLATMGAGLGVAAAYGILAGMKAVLPRFAFAPEVVININMPVLLFCIAVALVTGILFGLGPALRLSRTKVGEMMQSNARRVLGSVHGRRTYVVLIGGQIALTLLLLAGAGSAMEGFVRLLHMRLGYDPHNVMSVGIPLHENTYTTWSARAAESFLSSCGQRWRRLRV